MDYNHRIRRNWILFIVGIVFLLVGCGFLVGFENFYKSILFVLPFLALLPLGGYYILKHFEGRKQFWLFAIWIGFIFAVTTMIGMLLDFKARSHTLVYVISVSGLVWLLTTLFVIVVTPVYSALFRFWKRP